MFNLHTGKCECEEGFASEDCSFDLNAPLVVYGLDNDGLCDTDDGCDFVVVEGQDFPTDRNYTCQFSGREVSTYLFIVTFKQHCLSETNFLQHDQQPSSNIGRLLYGATI